MDSAAIVTSIEGEHALVEVQPAVSGCGRCNEAGGCGSGLLNQALRPRRRLIYRVANRIGARVGDSVTVTVPEGAVLRAALLAYLLPVLLVIAGAALGTAISASDLVALVGAGAGLALGLLVLRLAQRRLAVAGEPLLAMRLKQVPTGFIKDLHT